MQQDHTDLWAISPLDGRYASKLSGLGQYVGEGALIRYRTLVEVEWLLHLAETPTIKDELVLSKELKEKLVGLAKKLTKPEKFADAAKVKEIEATTNHDVKAIEYYLREQLAAWGASDQVLAYLHFACTSEDINNTSYALMLKQVRQDRLLPQMDLLLDSLSTMALAYADTPMLSRTHGQTASPTTLGKEVGVFIYRLKRQRQKLAEQPIEAKMNGAVGNYNAHVAAFPGVDWPRVSQEFLEKRLGLSQNPMTTQIENHDTFVEMTQVVAHFNTILIDLARDFWSYIAWGYFGQKQKAGEVGSSTMPHKVNPIDFENAEGNLGVANSLSSHFRDKLPISRWQRDLSDSTVLRTFGTFVGHSELAYQALLKGFGKLTLNELRLASDLDNSYEVMAEPVQTVMRRYGVVDAYERLKAATRGKAVDRQAMEALINGCDELPPKAKADLLAMTPASYVGLAASLVRNQK